MRRGSFFDETSFEIDNLSTARFLSAQSLQEQNMSVSLLHDFSESCCDHSNGNVGVEDEANLVIAHTEGSLETDDDYDDDDDDNCNSGSGVCFVDLCQFAAEMHMEVEDFMQALRSSCSRPSSMCEGSTSLLHAVADGSSLFVSGGNSNGRTCVVTPSENYFDSLNELSSKSGRGDVKSVKMLSHSLSIETIEGMRVLSFSFENALENTQEREFESREAPDTDSAIAPVVVFPSASCSSGFLRASLFPSTESTAPVSDRAPLLQKSSLSRRIRFGSRVVTNVYVYSVDDDVYLGVYFCQHWSSWAALVCGFFLECLFDVHLSWFFSVLCKGNINIIPIVSWVYTYRAIFSVIYAILWLALTSYISSKRSSETTATSGVVSYTTVTVGSTRGTCIKSFVLTLLSSSCILIASSCMIVAYRISGSSLMFVASALHCLWIFFYRVVRKQMVFLVEVCGSVILFVGNVLSNIESLRVMSLHDLCCGGLLMAGCSLFFAFGFLLMAQGIQQSLCNSAGITVAVGIGMFLVTLILGVCYGYPLTSGAADSLNAIFGGEKALHTPFLALEDLLFSLMHLYALYHLDVLSVLACLSLKAVFVSVVSHYAVWGYADVVPLVEQKRWGLLLFVGFALVLVATAVVTYFSSVRRRFVARRLFHMRGLRRVPNPYAQKTRKKNRQNPCAPCVSLRHT